MDSNTSTAAPPTSTEAVITLTIPQDIIDEILDHLAIDTDPRVTLLTPALRASLRSCALVSKPWAQSCRRHLFRVVDFTSTSMDGWFETFLVPEESPAQHVRDLRIWTGGREWAPENLFQYTQRFSNLERMSLMGYGEYPPLEGPSFWKLPQSITSLAIETDSVTLAQVRDIILAQLPNLDDLSLSGFLSPTERMVLVGDGTVPRGRFGGKLALRDGCAGEDVFDMLLGITSGLRFAEVWIHCTGERLPSVVRLVEACCKTLVKLSHTVSFSGCETFERSFDLSKLPNLQEVNLGFRIGWRGGVPWIHTALSTLRPATSPCLSSIRLDFSCSHYFNPAIETLIGNMGNNLRLIADEVSRIEREFKGAANLTVLPDPKFELVLDTLNILQHYGRSDWIYLTEEN